MSFAPPTALKILCRIAIAFCVSATAAFGQSRRYITPKILMTHSVVAGEPVFLSVEFENHLYSGRPLAIDLQPNRDAGVRVTVCTHGSEIRWADLKTLPRSTNDLHRCRCLPIDNGAKATERFVLPFDTSALRPGRYDVGVEIKTVGGEEEGKLYDSLMVGTTFPVRATETLSFEVLPASDQKLRASANRFVDIVLGGEGLAEEDTDEPILSAYYEDAILEGLAKMPLRVTLPALNRLLLAEGLWRRGYVAGFFSNLPYREITPLLKDTLNYAIIRRDLVANTPNIDQWGPDITALDVRDLRDELEERRQLGLP